MRGVKVRKSDGLLHDVLGSNVMLACGGFEGNPEMLAKYIGNRTAGERTGLFYHEYPPPTSVLRSLTFGRIAGSAIAQKL